MNLDKIKLSNKDFLIGLLISLALFSIFLQGSVGLRVILGSLLVFFLPFYLILDNFKLQTSEKVVFSFFMGIGIYSTFVYYLGFIFSSIRIGMLATLVLLVGVGILLRKFLSVKKED